MFDNNKRKAFTLIELLVVIAIIAILAAILFPVFAKAREKARQSTCASNEKQMALGVLQYLQDYDEIYPLLMVDVNNSGMFKAAGPCCGAGGGPYLTWADRINPYIKSQNVFYCPDVIKGYPGNDASAYCQYGFNMYFVQYIDTDIRGTVPGYVMLSSAKVNSPSNIIMLTDQREGAPSRAGMWGYNTAYTYPYGYLAFPEVTGANCITSGIDCLADPIDPRHTGRFNAAFADGHVKSMVVNTTAAGEDVGALYGQIDSYGSSNDLGTNWNNAFNATAKPYWCPYN